jgi:hypothetical protein
VFIRRTARGATALGISGAKMSAWDTLPAVRIGWPTPDHLLMKMQTVVLDSNWLNGDCMV